MAGSIRAARASCAPKATKGACKDLTTAYVNACPNEADNIAKCKNFFAGIAMSCSGGPTNTIDTTP